MRKLLVKYGNFAGPLSFMAMVFWRLCGGLPVFILALALVTLMFSRACCMRLPRSLRIALPLFIVGAASNGLAVLSNGGSMPVIAPASDIAMSAPAYVELTADSHFYYLCDVIHRCSVGDLFIAGGFCVALLTFLAAKISVGEYCDVHQEAVR